MRVEEERGEREREGEKTDEETDHEMKKDGVNALEVQVATTH